MATPRTTHTTPHLATVLLAIHRHGDGHGIIDPNDLLLAIGSLLDRDCR